MRRSLEIPVIRRLLFQRTRLFYKLSRYIMYIKTKRASRTLQSHQNDCEIIAETNRFVHGVDVFVL